MDITVERVTHTNLEIFCSILLEAVQWLNDEDKAMWTIEDVSKGHILKQYALEEMYIGFVQGTPAATIVLQEIDRFFWPNESKGDSLFLHKLCVRRQFSGQGLASCMIDFAKNEARKQNKAFLRLDCAADRPALCAFYEANGFKKVREQRVFDRFDTAFYEYSL
ncbi:GNAT family N-acetyltransferase [Aureibacillus halotolerans]|uniref:Acetyltransferase (GNAT) family protein n=1 Tax=Aureibacillus halotolerans TaxID=1508390 RepID=A0A4R6UAI4_9BACI|nr:GNAT family N-acetyltransferase [Aureibacillus halotolerans]TDQ42866.1 acetyltransferase (GNAT) family protein [Aureibacillus halotolerans]